MRQLLGKVFSRGGCNTDKGHIHVPSYTPGCELVIHKLSLLHELVTIAYLCPPGKPSPSLRLWKSYQNFNFYNIYLLATSVFNPTLSSALHLCSTYNNVLKMCMFIMLQFITLMGLWRLFIYSNVYGASIGLSEKS